MDRCGKGWISAEKSGKPPGCDPDGLFDLPDVVFLYVGCLRSRRAVVLAIGMACTWDLNCHA
jgi:hypothetical protein